MVVQFSFSPLLVQVFCWIGHTFAKSRSGRQGPTRGYVSKRRRLNLIAAALWDYSWIICVLGQVNAELLRSWSVMIFNKEGFMLVSWADRCEVAYDKLIKSIRHFSIHNRLSLTCCQGLHRYAAFWNIFPLEKRLHLFNRFHIRSHLNCI